MNFKRIFFQAAVIAVVGALAGIAFNTVRAEGIPIVPKDVKKASTDLDADTGPVDLESAKKLFDQGAVFVDARAAEEYGRGHIKGAIHIYYVDVKKEKDRILQQIPLDKTVVAYCSGEECHSSDIVAQELLDLGYEKVRIFFAGWPAWKAAGYPQEPPAAAPEPLYKPMGAK